MPQRTGGCLCGAVRYTTDSDPAMTFVCHCRDCQKFSGSAFGALAVLPREAVAITGTMKTFSSVGGSGKPILRHFCPECGSSIAAEAGVAPGRLVLNVGTLDDPKSVAPVREHFCDDALPWVRLTGDMQRFATRPG